MGIGRDLKVRFQRFNEGARNEFNEPAPDWQDLCTSWAAREDLTDVEAVAAGQEGSVLSARFTVRSNPQTRALRGADRLVIGTEEFWNVKRVVADNEGRNRHVIVTAVLKK